MKNRDIWHFGYLYRGAGLSILRSRDIPGKLGHLAIPIAVEAKCLRDK